MTLPVLYEVQDRCAVITMNRPERHHAVNMQMRGLLIEYWNRVNSDPLIDVAILTASTARIFCSGKDLSEHTDISPRHFLPIIGESIEVKKPTIAAVEGAALGAGWFFAQMCDLVVASQCASFSLPEVKVGRVPAWAVHLRSIIGEKLLLQAILTGEPFTAERAYQIGLVNKVVEPGHALAGALEIAYTISKNAPLAVRAGRQMVYASQGLTRQQAVDMAFDIGDSVSQSADAQEGINAFREKRSPVWRCS
jgi:enoyl-CoA hydratase